MTGWLCVLKDETKRLGAEVEIHTANIVIKGSLLSRCVVIINLKTDDDDPTYSV